MQRNASGRQMRCHLSHSVVPTVPVVCVSCFESESEPEHRCVRVCSVVRGWTRYGMLSYRCPLHVVLQVQRCARMDEVWVPTHFHKAVFEKRCARISAKALHGGTLPMPMPL